MKKWLYLILCLSISLIILTGCGASDPGINSSGSSLNGAAPELALDPGIPLPTPENTYEVPINRAGTSPLALGWNSFIFPAIGPRPLLSISMTYAAQDKILKDAAGAKWTLNYVLYYQKRYFQLYCDNGANVMQPGTRYWVWSYKSGAVLNFTKPNISQLFPPSGFAGTSITVQGVNFGAAQGGSSLSYAGTPVTPDSWSDTAITFTLPSGANSGAVRVTVNSEASNTANFTLTWQSMSGSTGDDWAEATLKTSDGGCVTVGESDSTDIPGCVNHGGYDALIIKYDSLGAIQWQKMYGGNDSEVPYCVQQTADGGYIIMGQSLSTDIPGCVNHGQSDCYVLKLSSAGELQWQTLLGGSNWDDGYAALQTPDGGYLVGGDSLSDDIPGCVNRGSYDYYYVKLAGNGAVQWQKMLGGNDTDYINCIIRTAEGSYLLMGTSFSTDIPGCVNHGSGDYFMVKISSTGTVLLQKMYGGNDYDKGASVLQTSDKGFVLAGSSCSLDIPGCVNHGSPDGYAVKITSTGTVQWQSMFGGSRWEDAIYVVPAADGGYAVGGFSESSDIPGCLNHGQSDMYLVKLSSGGAVLWQRMYGGSSDEYLWNYCVSPAADGGFFMGCVSYSDDIPGCVQHGSGDVYAIKMDARGNLGTPAATENFDSYPPGPLSDAGSLWYGMTSDFYLVSDFAHSSPNSLFSSAELSDVYLDIPPGASGRADFWVRFADLTNGNDDFIFALEDANHNALADIELFDNFNDGGVPNPQIQFQYYTDQAAIPPILSHLSPDTWYKVTFVWRASDSWVQMYLNDQLAMDWLPPDNGPVIPSVIHIIANTGGPGKVWYDDISVEGY